MSITYLKKALQAPESEEPGTRETVRGILQEIRTRGEAAVREYARKFDGWEGDFRVSEEEVRQAAASLSRDVKDDIHFAYEQIFGFAVRQRESLTVFEAEFHPGVTVGQRIIPVNVAGCYVPGGRFAHVASALMTIATAKAAGVPFVISCSPSHQGAGIHAATLYAMALCKSDVILTLGGVQAIATLAYGLFTNRPADVLVGPGNRYVAEAKRILFGDVGIDLFAGPSELLIVADESADARIVAIDLLAQAEHGHDSPVALVTTSAILAQQVLELMPRLIEQLREPEVSRCSWRDYGSVIWVTDREEALRVSNEFASEHVEIHVADLDWWLGRLTNYGSLFLGEETTVAYGDKASGPNHVLPTKKAARYTGGLSVGKFLKTVTYQRLTREASLKIGSVSARISRLEGMEAHALSCEARLEKYGPGGRKAP
jgi:sulfopropanediol 3-dehydrogenase